MLTPVLLLSRVTGQEVSDTAGAQVGRLTDLTIVLHGGGPQLVHRLVLRRPGGSTVVVPWGAVAGMSGPRLVVAPPDDRWLPFDADRLDAGEILLKRDVLDTQIVDVVGTRLARVADVLLARGPGGALETLGVEVGFSGVLRRLGLRRAAVGEDVVAWSDLHLTSERGHQVQLSTPRAAVNRIDVRAAAALVNRVDADAAGEILAAREPDAAAELVRAAHPDVGEAMMRALPQDAAERIVEAMPAAHAGYWRALLARNSPRSRRRSSRSRIWSRRHLNWRQP